ncbi:MFS transporter [Candidatus Acetothermia bacterium]|nr:MAG: MFS transporter [Candidatus Acetothermia bacterium]
MVKVREDWKGPFFTIWTLQQFSLVGSQLVQFALVWWLTKTTGSATVLATATMIAILPQVLIGPFSGALVDRFSRRAVMIVADGSIALASAWLAYMYFAGSVEVWHIYMIVAIRAIGGGFHWPAMSASTALMVPERHLTRVAGLNQTMQGVTNIVSPPLGAIFLAILPMHGILGIDVATAALAIAPLLFIRIPRREKAEGRASYISEVREGFRYVWRWKGLLWVIGIAMLINFAVNPAFSLLPLLVRKHFIAGAIELSWLESAFGIGIVAGGIGLSIWGGFKRRIFTSLFGIVGMGVGVLLVGLLPGSGLYYALGALLLVGLMNPLANGPLIALLQSNVDPAMQGRVLALLGSLVTAMSPLSLALAGPIADMIGIQFWYIVGGLTMLVTGIGAFFIPAVIGIEEGRPAPKPAD